MKNIFIVLLLIFTSTLYAQYDGYFGKKFFLHYTTNGSYSPENDPYNQILNKEFYHHYFIRHHLNVEYLQSRNQSIMGGFGVYRLGFGVERVGLTNEASTYNITGFDLIAHKKYYRTKTGAISPFGKYFFIGGGVSYNHLTLEQNLPRTTNPTIENLGSLVRPVVFLGFGKQKVFAGNLLYNLGVECGLVVPKDEGDFDRETLEGRAYRRVAANHLLKVKFGITFPGF